MRRTVVKIMTGLLVAVVFGIAGCGGGSGSSASPSVQPTANKAMFSGKSFSTGSGTITFNADGTLSGAGINVTGETWTVNSSGQLVTNGSSKGTAIFTLVSGDVGSGWTVTTTYSDGSAATTGTLVPVATPRCTDSMFSGKSFSTGGAIITFNANGTLAGVGINVTGETWAVNSSGQLVTSGSSKGTAIFTLVSGDATNGWTGTTTYSSGSAATTGTLVPVATSGFTNAMISGRSFNGSGTIMTFNADGTLTGVGFISPETWTISASGQLVTYGSSKGTFTFTIISGDATNGWTGTGTYSNGTTATGTLVPV